ncbi:putative transposable element [Trichonephila clavipes]|uniref:Putative transposable element n=1 Tax=Trichonephila clavipes TaxID=2585209 RepID=A0A8X7BD35_TRICX|nr:putative transposable element [Trichonephila clavipes]
MITNFFIPELNNHYVQELWFQQDGATCHTARATIDLLKDKFGDQLISRFGPVNWPPRSCDLTPLDYFLWGYVKSLVYADKPQTFDHLEDNIRRVIADIRPHMLEKVIENRTSRLTTSEPAVAVICQKSYLNQPSLQSNNSCFGRAFIIFPNHNIISKYANILHGVTIFSITGMDSEHKMGPKTEPCGTLTRPVNTGDSTLTPNS